jgi:hypothetical protein
MTTTTTMNVRTQRKLEPFMRERFSEYKTMKTLFYSFILAFVVYVVADHSDVVLNWILELLDNPNF